MYISIPYSLNFTISFIWSVIDRCPRDNSHSLGRLSLTESALLAVGRRGCKREAAMLASGEWVSLRPPGEHEGNQCASVWRARCCTNEFRVLFFYLLF